MCPPSWTVGLKRRLGSEACFVEGEAGFFSAAVGGVVGAVTNAHTS